MPRGPGTYGCVPARSATSPRPRPANPLDPAAPDPGRIEPTEDKEPQMYASCADCAGRPGYPGCAGHVAYASSGEPPPAAGPPGNTSGDHPFPGVPPAVPEPRKARHHRSYRRHRHHDHDTTAPPAPTRAAAQFPARFGSPSAHAGPGRTTGHRRRLVATLGRPDR
ncbi:hypothetical protein GCM10010326_22370 [Streptomyces xanthochromogenes]|uniref:Uncharacterized protein n=1 Tax=Streptomyces xanthochromogenes TaxID=67384 RepID=A0ABQ3A0B4_9ACTN|nr:hypothetical protein GCM10010326_22370 [Streptomyces xanthochromogenes]